MSNANKGNHDSGTDAATARNTDHNANAGTGAIPRLQQAHPNELIKVHPQDFRKIQQYIHDLIVALPKGTSEETVKLPL